MDKLYSAFWSGFKKAAQLPGSEFKDLKHFPTSSNSDFDFPSLEDMAGDTIDVGGVDSGGDDFEFEDIFGDN